MRNVVVHLMLLPLLGWAPAPMAAAQENPAAVGDGPRFLLLSATDQRPVRTDARRTPVLNRRLSLSFRDTSVEEALAEISRQGSLNLAYADDIVPADRRVDLSADGITVAAALTAVLDHTGTDVVFTADGLATLVQKPPVRETPTGTLIGRVTSQGEPVAGVTVTVTPDGEEGSREATTDERGVYRLPALPPGVYSVRFELEGLVPVSEEARILPGETSNVDVQMSLHEVREDMVVTGTRIRGAGSTASPVLVLDRARIQESGLTTTHQFIQSLPQNFRGGVTEDTLGGILGGEGSNLNFSGASGANLRGLGNRATLTLLNGRRVAPVGVGETVDLSMIPLAAIERIDVLTDGASAIYGSDAVAGVINVVLRDDYAGAETNLSYGDVTEGSSEDYRIGQSFGRDWGSGNAFVGYEYAKRHALTNLEREFTRDASLVGGEIVPPNEQHSALAALSHELNDRIELFGEALFSTRESEREYLSIGFGAVREPVSSSQYTAGAGARIDLGNGWLAEAGASYSRNESDFESRVDDVSTGTVDLKSDVSSLDAKADGAVLTLPGGEVRLAVGAQYRHEAFDSRGTFANTRGEDARDVSAIFSEALIPFVGRGNARPGARRLELSLAGRYEDYSDFGSTANPKVGLLWSPAAGWNLRGTYGTSFRAPGAYEYNVNASPLRPIVYLIPDPQSTAPSGTTPTIVLFGNTGTLEPEEATSWTAGFDLNPSALPGLTASVTYFDIDYTDRIVEPFNTGFFNMLINEAQHAEFIMRNPDPALVAEYFDLPNLDIRTGGVPVTPADIGVIASNQRVNASRVKETGLDFSLGYSKRTAVGRFRFETTGTYLFDKLGQVTSSAPEVSQLNSLFNPVDLKLRNSIGWGRGNIDATLFLNYVDDYHDGRPGSAATVDSWTTVDLSARYRIPASRLGLQGVSLSLAALNVLDEPPPFIDYFGFNFDATNASALGRHLSIGITKGW